MKVNIVDIDHKGNGIARINNKIVFIPKCVTGDVVDIDIVKSHNKYDEGRVTIIINCVFDTLNTKHINSS